MSKKPDTGKPTETAFGSVTKAHSGWKRGVGRDRTDPRYHSHKARGGPIERRYIGVGIGFDDGVTLIETSIVRCCDEVKPGKMCPHGVWGFTKNE